MITAAYLIMIRLKLTLTHYDVFGINHLEPLLSLHVIFALVCDTIMFPSIPKQQIL